MEEVLDTLQPKKTSPLKTAFRYGIICALIYVALILVQYLTDTMMNPAIRWGSYIILIAMIYLGMKAHRDKDLGGFMRYGRGLGTGVLIALFSGLGLGFFMVILYTAIAPELVEMGMQMARDAMIEQGRTT